jgi:hypothetical protein
MPVDYNGLDPQIAPIINIMNVLHSTVMNEDTTWTCVVTYRVRSFTRQGDQNGVKDLTRSFTDVSQAAAEKQATDFLQANLPA